MLTGELRLSSAAKQRHISAPIATVVNRLLQRDPGERFQSADELLSALS